MLLFCIYLKTWLSDTHTVNWCSLWSDLPSYPHWEIQQCDLKSTPPPFAFHFSVSPAELRRRDSTELPLLGREQPRGPAAIPLLEYQSICPPCGLPFKQRKAIFSQHQHFSKAEPTLGEYIIIASRAHLVKQHLGERFHRFSSPHREGNSCPATLIRNTSVIMSC